MAKNLVFQPGDSLSLEVPAGTVSGQALMIGKLPAVAITDRGAGGNAPTKASVRLAGVARVPVAGALAEGAAVYITGAGALTATDTGNTLFGYNVGGTKVAGTAPTLVLLAKV